MQVPKGNALRDASGRFGCPKCWYNAMGILRPGIDEYCPNCNVEIEWESYHIQYYHTFRKGLHAGTTEPDTE